jgi:hypothetical protein
MRDIEGRNKPRAEEMRALANAKDWQIEYGRQSCPAPHASTGNGYYSELFAAPAELVK